MVEEKGTSKRLGSLWKSLRASVYRDRDRATLGILAFEVSKLMSKIINLWKCLSDREITRLREEIANSFGIRKLVSGDRNYLMNLALAEIMENVVSVLKYVIRLGKKCTDPTYHHLDRVFGDFNEIDPRWYGLRYKLKKMEKKIKKMETFVAATEQLHHEVEVLGELDQSLRRMQGGSETSQVRLLEFRQKIVLQRQLVKNLREMSPWVRSYDYVVRIFIKSLFTIFERIKIVDETYLTKYNDGSDDFETKQSDCLINRGNSISALLQASVYPLEGDSSRFKLHLGKSLSNLSLKFDLRNNSKNVKSHTRSQSFVFCGKQQYSPRARDDEAYVVESLCQVLKNTSGIDPILTNTITSANMSSSLTSKRLLLSPPTSTLGYAALALHYANIIVLIEKLATSSPHKISIDTRIDLYNMLPSTIRSSLRSKLKMFSRNHGSSVHDPAKWGLELERILEWLSPLAHNMIRWQSERNFERHRSTILESNVLLVQTLYFASQAETESAIVELLMGLNYISRSICQRK